MKAYVGGLFTGKSSVRRTARRLSEASGQEVAPFTYSWTVRNPDKFKAELERYDSAIIHCVGMLALVESGIRFDRLDAFAPPVPVSRAKLFGRSVMKTIDMIAVPAGRERSLRETVVYLGSSLAEMCVHPVSNLRNFVNGSISRFNAFEHVDIAQTSQIIYGRDDEYFGSKYSDFATPDVELIEVDGARHDDIILTRKLDHFVE